MFLPDGLDMAFVPSCRLRGMAGDVGMSSDDLQQLRVLDQYWRIKLAKDNRQTLEGLVAKGLVEKKKQRSGFSAMYRWTEQGKALVDLD